MDIQSIVTLFGGLAIFLYGMKTMSEALQQATGERLKQLLSRMTSNRLMGILSGLGITSVIQSSSATTVMVVGFVNAGLLTLKQAIGVIMGANIGTTVTAWIVATLGFKFNIAMFALVAIAFGVVFLFIGRGGLKGWGETLIGFGILFVGLNYLKDSIPDATKDPESFAFLRQYANLGFFTVVVFVFIGTFLTIILQSSSATAAITITLAYTGNIPLDAALGMVLGENLGTTITANLAALAGNLTSRKAAVAHTMFNVIGIVWALAAFPFLRSWVQYLFPGDVSDPTVTRFQISAFHTTFNIVNTLLLVWWVNTLARMVSAIVDFLAGKRKKKKKFQVLQGGPVEITELSLFEFEGYSARAIRKILKSFRTLEKLIFGKFSTKKLDQILEIEHQVDTFQHSMLSQLGRIQEKELSPSASREVIAALHRLHALESISDQFARMARKLKRADKNGVKLQASHTNILKTLFGHINSQYAIVRENIRRGFPESAIIKNSEQNKMLFRLIEDQENYYLNNKGGQKLKIAEITLFLEILRSLGQVSTGLKDMARAGAD